MSVIAGFETIRGLLQIFAIVDLILTCTPRFSQYSFNEISKHAISATSECLLDTFYLFIGMFYA